MDSMLPIIKKEVLDEGDHSNDTEPSYENLDKLQLLGEKVLPHILKMKVEANHHTDDDQNLSNNFYSEGNREKSLESFQAHIHSEIHIKEELNLENDFDSNQSEQENEARIVEYSGIKRERTCSDDDNEDSITLDSINRPISHLESASNELNSNNNHKAKMLKTKLDECYENMSVVNSYKCPICFVEFECVDAFKLHVEIHTNIDIALQASSVKKIDVNDVKTTDNKSKKVHSCDMCNYTSTHLNNLRTHKRTHSGERPFACKDCDYTSSQLVHLKSHQLIHLGLKPYACDECDHTCRDLSHLKAHKLLHTGVKPFACTDCEFTCRVASQLRVHRRIHTGEKPFPCDECDFVGDYAHSLKEHKQIHTGEKPYACDKCTYSSRWLRHLKTHQRVHTGEKPYSCDQCSYTSSQKSHLITHKRTHTGEKPYACDKCSYTSSQLTHIREHKRRHSDDKPFACDKCSYKTRTGQELKRHKTSWGHGLLPPKPRTKVKVKIEPN